MEQNEAEREKQEYCDMLENQAKKKLEAMIAEARSGRTASGFDRLGTILDTLAVESARKV
jgi:hypothetical protein